MARCVLVAGSLTLVAALIAVGIAFFGPFWLANVSINEQPTNGNATYFLYPFSPGSTPAAGGWIYVRGLWAQCGVRCQWFWQNNYVLQKNLFTPLSELSALRYNENQFINAIREPACPVNVCCIFNIMYFISISCSVYRRIGISIRSNYLNYFIHVYSDSSVRLSVCLSVCQYV